MRATMEEIDGGATRWNVRLHDTLISQSVSVGNSDEVELLLLNSRNSSVGSFTFHPYVTHTSTRTRNVTRLQLFGFRLF